MKKEAYKIIEELLTRYPQLVEEKSNILDMLQQMIECVKLNGKILICGNGGSASDADHIVGELMKGFKLEREFKGNKIGEIHLQGAICAINLCAQGALCTAISNDLGANMVYAQQVYGYGREGDILLGISTSGNSVNVINAGIVAKKYNLKTIGLTGQKNCSMDNCFDIVIHAPEKDTYRIQELHLPIYHAVCAALEEEIFGE